MRKRVGNSDTASKLAYRRSGSFSARFTRAITQSVIGLPIACVISPAGYAVFPAGKTSGFSRSGVIPLPLVSPQRNGVTIAQANTAAVRTATPSGFAKQTEKGLGSRGRACSQIGFQTLFQLDCRDLIAANYHARLVSLVLSLTQRKYVLFDASRRQTLRICGQKYK